MEEKTGIERWREEDGDNTYALDWPLDENSHVWEIGGFEGRWAQQIWDKFHCNITIFEPQLWAVEKMKERFKGIDKIEIRPYGLWVENGSFAMGNYETDGCSLLKNDNKHPVIPCDFKNHYYEILNFGHDINLCLMNIEGAEYHLLGDMIASGIVARFWNFWCQFHPDTCKSEEEAFRRYAYISREMGNKERLRYFEKIWEFYPTAVAWKNMRPG